ncbi:MAG: hypothetical protein LBT43_10360, partial [Prevotella sp.]|nr:hypothetical protein [Prevotella sp.]
MGNQCCFKITTYLHAQALHSMTYEFIEHGIQFFEKYCPLDKVYIETHRGPFDVPPEKIRHVQQIFLDKNIKVSGAITATLSIPGRDKQRIYDT